MNRASLLKRAAALVMAPSLLAKLPAPAPIAAAELPTVTAASASSTFISTAGAAYFLPNDILRNELTGENMRVTQVLSNGLEVERGIGTVKGVLPLPPAQPPKPPVENPTAGHFAWMNDELVPRHHPPYVLIANLSPASA